MTGSTIAVVIPTRNRREWLVEAIRSILDQDGVDFSVHVADNQSTDGSREAVAALGDPRVHVHIASNPLSAYGNHTRAVNLGSPSDYVALFHDDDIMRPGNLARKAAYLDAHPEASAVYSHYGLIVDGKRVREKVEWSTRTSSLESANLFAWRSARGIVRMHPSAAFMRRSNLEGLTFESEDKCFDLGFWLRLVRRGPIGFLDVPLVDIRMHAQSLSVELGQQNGALLAQDFNREIRDSHVASLRNLPTSSAVALAVRGRVVATELQLRLAPIRAAISNRVRR